MKGEFGAKLRKIVISRPYYRKEGCEPTFELQLVDENNEYLWIVGDNNIPKLMQEALHEYYKNKNEKKRR